MILTVTLNFALDVTYHVERVDPGSTVQVQGVHRQAGGKGVNAARVLHALGREVAVTGLAGGVSGTAARAELARAGLRDETVEVACESRQTLIVLDAAGEATGFSERGPEIAAEAWSAFCARYGELLRHSEVAVLAGSLPPGLPADAYGHLVGAAAQAGVPVVLDAHGEGLRRALGARPDIVKINRAELAGLARSRGDVAGARELRAAGARKVVITRGAEGLIAVAEGPALLAAPPGAVRGNPTGAGDAASAALAIALADGTPWPRALAEAAALSAAAAAAPVAGAFDAGRYRELQARVRTRELREERSA